MTMTLKGRIDWSMQRDKEGHRDYTIRWYCVSDDPLDGPERAFFTPGLPAIGSAWSFGNDSDAWAFCWPTTRVTPVNTKEPQTQWIVEQLFSTRPLSRCQDTSIEDPLSEPDRIGGSFVKYTKEVTKDRNGAALKSSSHEMLRGPIVEFDHNRPTVSIEKNLVTLPLATFAPMVDTVNDAVLWGLPARTIKLSNVSWQRKLYGTCTFYYVVSYEFDVDYSTFDRIAMDEGVKCLAGHTAVDEAGDGLDPDGIDPDTGAAYKLNPKRFVVYKDINGENTRCLLDGDGVPLKDGASPHEIDIEYYTESNFLTLGIPSSLV